MLGVDKMDEAFYASVPQGDVEERRELMR